jgi:hypothetical protein
MKRIGLLLLTCCSLLATPQSSPVINFPVQSVVKNTEPDMPMGPHVLGVFDGRTPCQELARQMKVVTIPECNKIKWRLTLFQDPATHAPTSYSLEGFVYRKPPRTGKWAILKGTKTDPNAIVYQLDPDNSGGFQSFLKVDDSILFFLDGDRNLLVGNLHFSYTLNRVDKVPRHAEARD